MKVNFYINNKKITEPLNYQELSLQLNYDADDPNAAVNINEWELGVGGYNPNKDGANLSNAHINNGLSGGVGIFEGLPFRIELEHAGNIQDIFSGYLDLTSDLIDCDLVNATAIEEGGVDWLNEVADSVSFEYLYEETKKM